ncbi:MAG: T9SS type A sorting domain-containing protein, partial [Flavobacteriaceae bacterium]
CASSIVLSLSKTDFTWVNIGDNQVTLYVTATVDGQDFTDSVTVKVTVQDAITHVSPNPVTNTLNIITTSDVQLKNAKIYSMSGEELLTDVSNQIDVSSLSSGMYILKIESVDGQIQMIKILKK